MNDEQSPTPAPTEGARWLSPEARRGIARDNLLGPRPYSHAIESLLAHAACADERLKQAEELLLSKNIDIAKLREEFANHIRLHDGFCTEVAAELNRLRAFVQALEHALYLTLPAVLEQKMKIDPCPAIKLAQEIATHSIKRAKQELAPEMARFFDEEIAAKDREIAELRKDRARLDWIDANMRGTVKGTDVPDWYIEAPSEMNGPEEWTLRESIDYEERAAMKETNAGKDSTT